MVFFKNAHNSRQTVKVYVPAQRRSASNGQTWTGPTALLKSATAVESYRRSGVVVLSYRRSGDVVLSYRRSGVVVFF